MRWDYRSACPNAAAYVGELTPREMSETYEVRAILEIAAALRNPLPLQESVL
jgi:DNA-binding GntR family transcriptional regulator